MELRVRAGTRTWAHSIRRSRLQESPQRKPPFPLKDALKTWRAAPSRPPALRLQRVTIEAVDPEVAALRWETAFDWGAPVVRVSSVRPHSGDQPFKLPLRIVQVGAESGVRVPALVFALFGRKTQTQIRDAVRVLALPTLASLEAGDAKLGPVSDVVHFDCWDEFAARPDLLSFADPAAIGTVAWLARSCLRRQTRLVVLHAPVTQRERAIGLAAALIGAGGPAMLVESLAADERLRFYRQFYSDLIHDFPLDSMLQNAQATPDDGVILFAGAGREDELRVSTVGLRALRIPRRATPSKPLLAGASPLQENRIRQVLGSLHQEWNSLQFEFHEHDGLIPLADKIRQVRSAARLPAKRRPPVLVNALRPPTRVGPTSSPARFVNIGFWQSDGAALREIRQRQAMLPAGEVCQLGVDIGPKNVRVRVANLEAIDEERFRWSKEMKGVWVEIGVTGIDFEVLGNPVRELWLPREGASERIHFPVIPRASGVARLRVCLYHHQDIVQSFRVVAVVGTQGAARFPARARRQIAAALGLPQAQVRDAGFLARLEYHTGSVQDVAVRREPSGRHHISIVANDWDGDTVVTVKGPGLYAVKVLADADIPPRIRQIRGKLKSAFVRTFADGSTAYAFGVAGQPNLGTEDQLRDVLTGLVVPGWRLFDKLVLEEQRAELDRLLSTDDVTIHVAHILREKVIPWSLLYDRPFDKNMREDAEGNPVGFAFCRAALPDGDGKLGVRECFRRPECVLFGHPERKLKDAAGRTLLPETVVCPLHFWGFRSVLEVPPYQVAPGAKGVAMATEIPVEKEARVVTGLNGTLPLCQSNLSQLQALKTKCAANWNEPQYNRQKIIEALKHPNVHLVYFYCHANAGEDDGVNDPELLFQAPGDKEAGVITPDELTYRNKWARHPLVFLNGCATVGYTPEALSPFFKKLVDDRGAAGLIVTEVPVWEQLAGDVARRLFGMLLNGERAGPAMLAVRRQLLAQNNPLALVYTLYAAADLHLVLP